MKPGLTIPMMLFLASAPAPAQTRFSFEAFLGVAHNFGTTLTVEQEGEPELRLDADYGTRPFELPPYYSGRFAIHDESGAWEIQFTHHKLYLENNTSEIQSFEITHGFNLLVFGRAFTSLPVDLRVMGGVVIAHPDSEVRGKPFSPGYQLTGPALVVGAGKKVDLATRLFVSLDAQFLSARARVPINMGTASAPNLSVHLLFGLGFRF